MMCGHLWSQDYHGEGVPCPFCLHDELAKEKARAEKAEAKARILADHVAKWSDKSDELGAALAAARRECEGLRKALTTIRDECSFMLNRDIPWVRHVAAEALAAPAAGEEHQFLPPYRAHHLATVRIHTDKCAAGEYDPECLPPKEYR